jgi:hypothetical protein
LKAHSDTSFRRRSRYELAGAKLAWKPPLPPRPELADNGGELEAAGVNR